MYSFHMNISVPLLEVGYTNVTCCLSYVMRLFSFHPSLSKSKIYGHDFEEGPIFLKSGQNTLKR